MPLTARKRKAQNKRRRLSEEVKKAEALQKKKWHSANAERRKLYLKEYSNFNWLINPTRMKAISCKTSSVSYKNHLYKNRCASAKSSKKQYELGGTKSKIKSRLSSRLCYKKNRLIYQQKSRMSSRAHYVKRKYINQHKSRLISRKNYAKEKDIVNAHCKSMYSLFEPSHLDKEHIHSNMLKLIQLDKEFVNNVRKKLNEKHVCDSSALNASKKIACKLVTSKLLDKVYQYRRKMVSDLLAGHRKIAATDIKSKTDFGKTKHSKYSEPYFYDAAYLIRTKQSSALAISIDGKCMTSEIVKVKGNVSWGCSTECKVLTDDEVQSVLELKKEFDKPIMNVRHFLDSCDSCPNMHFSHILSVGGEQIADEMLPRLGHPLVCYNNGGCKSKLRILRCAAVHYPVLSKLLRHVYTCLQSHLGIKAIDVALNNSNYKALINILKLENIDEIFVNELECCYHQDFTMNSYCESKILLENATVVAEFEKHRDDFFEYPCISCRRLYKRGRVSKVNLSNSKIKNDLFNRLKCYLVSNDCVSEADTLYMCHSCKSDIKRNILPNKCILNGLEVVPIPHELSCLDVLSLQLVQRAKCYQTIVRLGTYTGKVPMYNSLKACKGIMFFLPLPMKKTLETLDKAKSIKSSLPDPELYVIVNSKPTAQRVVWRSLVDVNKVKNAVKKLKEINWLYSDVHDIDDSVDEVSKKVIEELNKASSTMLFKANASDIASFQSYTIRNLDSKLVCTSDIEQYKLGYVREEPIDNRQRYLDVMCFPRLFPTGKFGEHHPREKKVAPSEYIKTRLLNNDSRFRKNPQYVFFLLWQKELRELNAGIYNALKTYTSQPRSIQQVLNQVACCNDDFECNLSTILQSVRGTKQYWFCRFSEVKAMIREYGPPSLFLTFSCAEYESKDISDYLKKVNNIPTDVKCNIPKLCCEDPISVTRQFTSKFKSFFNCVLIKGKVLGEVSNFYYKIEFAIRGAPHYHVLLWIKDAPIIGKDEPSKILAWIQERITCHIPDKTSNPELYTLVTKYQSHKCCAYCKRTKKLRENLYITKCKFGFPREACDLAKLNPVEESLKSKDKIYQIVRNEAETRINDYNPLLLYLWRANIDIQFIGESSYSLAHYVSGYVTKAERSNLQEVWDNVSQHNNIYSRLWSFGIRSLRVRECGLYEAAVLLLGEELTKKSCTVKWVNVSMPHKRSRRIRSYSQLQELARNDPNSDLIYEENVVDNHYPNRPKELDAMCLYDFVANIDWYAKDKQGRRQYKRLKKPRLPNHKLFDLEKEEQKEDYYYSLILLFVPFRNESELLLPNEKTEEAFDRLLQNSVSTLKHHAKLQRMLTAQFKINEINKCRLEVIENAKCNEDDEDLQLKGEPLNDIIDMGVNTVDTLDLDTRISMLNADQLRLFEKVKDHLVHQHTHDQNMCKCDLKPLRIFLTGVGGTGKSFLIETLKQLVASIWKINDLTCAISAPTGLAAFNVGGVTVHRLFQLPVEHEGRTCNYWSLPKASQKSLKTSLKHVKLFIIDEVSMVSSLNLAYIHLRLDEIFGTDEWFGGRNMLLVGDLLQLQPVNGKPIFERIGQKSLTLRLGCVTAINIWNETMEYDELSINERQKSDKKFTMMLDSVRRGFPTDETLSTLKDKVIRVPVVDKVIELTKDGKNPVCLFPMRKSCDELNNLMLNSLESKVVELVATDEIDQSSTVRKWTNKANQCLNKLNQDCNMTAGLEAKLRLAVGARVMLRRNLDTKCGLVNGAIGTVENISAVAVTVKFDHKEKACEIERVKSRFLVMKNFFVYRRQFPLILAYAVTIHKCQGLSLDCALIDLSDNVFACGMAYVALSRVRSLSGLYLTEFNPNSIKVSHACLRELNRLRKAFRADLALYDIPPQGRTCGSKRKLIGELGLPSSKRTKQAGKKSPKSVNSRVTTNGKVSSKRTTPCDFLTQRDKKFCASQPSDYDPRTQGIWPFSYNPVNEHWQRGACAMLRLNFTCCNDVTPGGQHVPLTRPNIHSLYNVIGDGNCMFRAFSYIITGSQSQYHDIRSAVVRHMLEYDDLCMCSAYMGLSLHYDSVSHYLSSTRMGSNETWGTTAEVVTLSHLLRTPIFVYSLTSLTWQRHLPSQIDPSLAMYESNSDFGIFLFHSGNHYLVVRSIQAVP